MKVVVVDDTGTHIRFGARISESAISADVGNVFLRMITS